MGRKKKGLRKSQEELEQEVIEELKADFLALCAVEPPEDESRTELGDALLALRLAQEDDYETIEDAASRLRVAHTDFLKYLVLERREIFEIYQDLQAKRGSLSIQDLLAFECVYRTYLNQISQEEKLMDSVLNFLDKLYQGPKDNRQLGIWIRQFGKRQLMRTSSRVATLKVEETEGAPYELPENIAVESLALIEISSNDPTSSILEARTVIDAAQAFLDASSSSFKNMASLLVVGPPGSGKTHMCTEIESAANYADAVQVFRPKLPVDFMGASVGDAEYTIGSLFEAVSASGKSVLILDDLDVLVGTESLPDASIELRMRVSFLSRLDQLRKSNTLLICTASTPLDDELARFNKTFLLQAPDREERIGMTRRCLGINDSVESLEQALDTLATCMLGRSRGEVAQYCREAIRKQLVANVDIASLSGKHQVLTFMVSELSGLSPESLRSGVSDGFVDMTVVSSAELLQGTITGNPLSLPLLGEGMDDAWRQLEALIVTPLCQSRALDEILSGGHADSQRTFCGGALLTGAAATGKTALAYHAARVASRYLPSVKLLDVSCTSLVHKEVGGSERAMRRLFAAVRAAAPCILLMDGIENIAGVRGKDNTTHGTMDRILSTLLTELDGVDNASSSGNSEAHPKFAMIGITHEVSWIDTALRRPGRLDKTILLRKPDREARQAIVRRQLDELVLHDDFMNIEELSGILAHHTEGETAAEIATLCEKARMASVMEAIVKVGLESGGLVEPELRYEHFSSLVAADDVSV